MKVLLVCLMLVSLGCDGSSNSTRLAAFSCECGWRNVGRIVGGKETRKNEYPWMVHLSNGCGGSIITPWHVLTAAHCTANESARTISVSVGRHYKLGINEQMKYHRVAKIIQHEKYSINNDHPIFDISILQLARPIKFNQHVGPVCMPNRRLHLVGKLVKVMGWGITLGTGDENVLREVCLEVVSNRVCKKSWRHFTNTQLCAYTPKKDSCNGDSGGPLVYLDPASKRYTQVALVSYGSSHCGNDGKPSVNTDLFSFIRWIRKALSESHPGARVCTKV